MDFLPEYIPNEALLEAVQRSFCKESLVKFAPILGEYQKKSEITYENYYNVFRALLAVEDITQMDEYAKLIQINEKVRPHTIYDPNPKKRPNKYCIKMTGKNEALLSADMDEIVFVDRTGLPKSPLPTPLVMALFHGGHVETISKITPKLIIFPWSDERFINQKELPNKLFDIIFRSPRVPVRLMYLTLGLFVKNDQLRRYIFPIPDVRGKQQLNKIEAKPTVNLTLFNESIKGNLEQLQAVQQIVMGPNPRAPYIVFGPPGTGKTTTVVEAILQLFIQSGMNRILVTAGSNSACDTIALRICEYVDKHPKFQSKLKNNVILRLYPFKRVKQVLKTTDPLLLKYSNCKKAQPKNMHEALRKINLQQYSIVVATLCTVGILAHVNNPKFTHVFIDEAAASTEPETLLGIVEIKKNSPCHVILSGDHKQLGAVIKSAAAASLGLGQSMMQRLLQNKLYDEDSRGNYDRTLLTKLIQNYRSHPEIVNVFNKLFYNGSLIPMAPLKEVSLAANWSMLPNKQFPIIFQATCGPSEIEENSTSSYNKQEAEVLCWYLMKLLKEGIGGGVQVQREDIGIVSPYLAQCKLLTKMLRQLDIRNVKVGSVESYQGREKPIIIVSMVTSFKSPRFLSNPQRVNVMLSRAKSLMILIGNPVTLSKNQNFEYIVKLCQLKGTHLFYTNAIKDDLKKWKMDKLVDEAKGNESDNDSDGSASSISSIQKPMIYLSV